MESRDKLVERAQTEYGITNASDIQDDQLHQMMNDIDGKPAKKEKPAQTKKPAGKSGAKQKDAK